MVTTETKLQTIAQTSMDDRVGVAVLNTKLLLRGYNKSEIAKLLIGEMRQRVMTKSQRIRDHAATTGIITTNLQLDS